MKITWISLIILNLIGFMACSQKNNPPLNCTDFRDGKFELYIEKDKIEFERTGSKQIEKSPWGNSIYEIQWLSDCEYVLTLKQTEIDFSKKNIGRKYFVKITETKEDQYSYETRVEGIGEIDKSIIYRVK